MGGAKGSLVKFIFTGMDMVPNSNNPILEIGDLLDNCYFKNGRNLQNNPGKVLLKFSY